MAETSISLANKKRPLLNIMNEFMRKDESLRLWIIYIEETRE